MWLRKLRRILFSLALLFLCIVGFAAGWWVSKSNQQTLRPLELPSIPAEEAKRARALVEEALTARFEGRNGKAVELLDEAALADPSLTGLDFQRGLAFFFDGNFDSAEAAAKVSLAKNDGAAGAYALLVMCAAGRAARGETTDPRQVEEWARSARAKDPLAPFVHYAMGEYARAVGQPREAVEHYRRALERVSAADSYLVATVKAGLSGLRLGQDSDPKPVMPSIADENVPPEWLFFAAGQALLDGDPETARVFLERARKVVRPEIFSALLKDSFFQDFLPEGMLTDPQQ